MTITIKYFDNTKITLPSVESITELPSAQMWIKTYGNIPTLHKNVLSIEVTGYYRKDNS